MHLRSPRVRRLGAPPAVICSLLALTGSAAAANPWNLRCAATAAEQPLPRAVAARAHRFFPWIATPSGLRDGPVLIVALSSHTAVSRDGDGRDGAGYYLHRALIVLAPSYRGAVTVAGTRLGRPGPRTTLGFSTNGANHCTVSGQDVRCGDRPLHYASRLAIARARGWRIVETQLRIGRTGCFRVTATGAGLKAEIPLSVPGPDWGTPGW